MKDPTRFSAPIAALAFLTAAASALAADWPQWGGDWSRNMVSTETGLPTAAEVGKRKPKSDETDPATTKNVKWVARLGSQSYGNPTVAGGKIFVGANNASPRDPAIKGDYGVLMCFEETTGKFLWQLLVPKLAAGKVSDWELIGLCSSPAIDAGRVYVVTNRCEVVCLDVNGLADGNDGDFQDEAQYAAGPGKPPAPLGPGHADILWRFDMRDELGVFPHNMTSSSVLIVGDRLYATTSNSVDWTLKHVPSPGSPALVCLDKNTGKLLGEERSGISSRVFNSNWSSPAYGAFNGKPLVIFGGGDGICYGFDPEPVTDGSGAGTLKEVWRFDCNPTTTREKNGKPVKYGHPGGPNEIIATPVVVKDQANVPAGSVYVASGQDPEKGDGKGLLHCIDGTGAGDVTQTGKTWSYDKISRSLSTVAVADGLIYAADYAGVLHCVDAKTGQPVWTHDTEARIWGSPLVADGKVYLGNENGLVLVFAAGREKKELGEIDFKSQVYSTPVAANGVLYITTDKNLYALHEAEKK